MQKQVILVAGMHRSGTSLINRLLNLHGVHIPIEIEYKNEFNVRGYWESFEVQALNDKILRLGDSSWFDLRTFSAVAQPREKIEEMKQEIDEFAERLLAQEYQSFAIKDPRICRVIPWWLSAFERCGARVSAIIPYRHPLEVAASIGARDGFDARYCLSLWLRNVLDAEFATRQLDRVFCSYEGILSDWPSVFCEITEKLQLSSLRPYSEVKKQIDDFASRSLRHWSFSDSDLENFAGSDGLANIAFQYLRKFEQEDSTDMQDRFDVIREASEKTLSIHEELKDQKSRITFSGKGIGRAAGSGDQGADRLIKDFAVTKQKLLEKESLIDSLGESIKRRKEEFSDLTERFQSLDVSYRLQKQELADLRAQFETISNDCQAVVNSLSWRITRPLRAVYDFVYMAPAAMGRLHSKLMHSIRKLSSDQHKLEEQLELVKLELESRQYVPITTEAPPSDLPVKLIAFYLPQFHPIPENDEWWGKGFTEWDNVKPARPRFSGHHQPRIPGELGYYDLRDDEVQKRQVELAKLYGLGGFCFYFYWFNGTRLLEKPILQFRDNKALDMPFCLCWANENWSRIWDGLDNHVLIRQHHSVSDDLAFIEYISEYFSDERYILIGGKPLLLVYRPELLPDPVATATRWRDWCLQNRIGEIFLACPQSFTSVDPVIYGFDAAVEFPPNNTVPEIVTEQMSTLDAEFEGYIYDWTSVAFRARAYEEPEYPLFRTVNPGWDNTARRKNDGAVFVGSTPSAYGEWLENAAQDTVKRFSSPSSRLVFVNAWNEWAEGAYLEPDQAYGYAYLQATRNALENVSRKNTDNKIVLVIHDALAHGAQYLTLYLAKTLSRVFGFNVDLVVLGDGLLLSEFQRWTNVHSLAGLSPDGPEAVSLAQQLFAEGNRAAIVNTTVSGAYIQSLTDAGFRCISLVHELRTIIESYELQEQAAAIAQHADSVVFAARKVADSFLDIVDIPDEKVIIRPQGLYKKNAYRKDNLRARSRLKAELGLDEDARVVLGVGYLDHRKGVDLFVDAALHIMDSMHDTHFVWVGHWDPSMKTLIEEKLAAAPSPDRFHFVGRKDDTDIYYAGADVFVLSSREDPFPSTVMESLEVGIPVVAFKDAGGFESLLERDCGILVPFEDSLRLAEAIMELLNNPALAGRLGNTGASIIDREFSFRHYVYDLLDLAGAARRRISVIVPNYNYARYLEQRLNSIFLQTYPVFELIVLDDASSDNSLEIIKSCLAKTDTDHQLIVNRKNSGSAFEQWRKAIKLARGDFIWICEADDFAEPDFLEKCIDPFGDPKVVLSYSQSMQVDENGKVTNDDYLDYTNEISKSKWLRDYVCDGFVELSEALAVKNTIPNVSAVIFRKTALQESLAHCERQIKKLKIAGDWLIYSDLLQKGRIAFTAESLNAHRRHHKSITIDLNNNNRHMAEIIYMQNRISRLVNLDQETVAKAKGFEQHAYQYLGLAHSSEDTVDPVKLPEVREWLNRISNSF